MIRGARRWLRIYPYWCSEQVASAAEPLVALLQAGPVLGDYRARAATARTELARAVATLSRRQRTRRRHRPLERRRLDHAVAHGVRRARCCSTPRPPAWPWTIRCSRGSAPTSSSRWPTDRPVVAPVARWYADGSVRLSDRVMAVDYLSRAGLRDRAAENELLRLVRAARLGGPGAAGAGARAGGRSRRPRARCSSPPGASVTVEGRTATLPKTRRRDVLLLIAASGPPPTS